MDRTRWIVFGVLCAAIVGGLVYMSGSSKVNVDSVDAFTITTNRDINDHVFGNKDAKVVVYEYADFQCPGCAGAYPNLKTITETYKNQVAFVYRSFPLTSIHPHAFAAAATAEAAGLQGKYWEMHDQLFETQDTWKNLSAEARQNQFEQYAQALGLNVDQFRADLAGEKVAAKINFDRSLGLKVGVDSTPTVFINKEKIANDIISDVIQQQGKKLTDKLDEAIKQAGGTVPTAR